jgi:hypothetical protein
MTARLPPVRADGLHLLVGMLVAVRRLRFDLPDAEAGSADPTSAASDPVTPAL